MFKKMVIVVAIVASSFAGAHEDPTPATNRNVEIAFNPAGLFLSRLSGQIKFKVAEHVALEIPVSAGYWFFGTSQTGTFDWWSVYSGLGARFFISAPAFETGWYVEGMLQVGYSNFEGTGAFVVNPWFLAGYGWFFDSGFTVSLGLGVQYNYYTTTAFGQPEWAGFPLPVAEISIGYSW